MKTQFKNELQQLKTLEQEIQRLKRSLLAAPAQPSELSLPLDVLVLKVDNYLIALPVDLIEKVTPMVMVSPLPGAPATVRGTVSYRGYLAPVLDLNYAFSGTLKPLLPEMFLAIVKTDQRMFALSVDHVENVIKINKKDLDSAPLMSSLPGFVRCLLRINQQAVVLLDPEGLLAAAELDVLQDLLADIKSDQELE